VSANPLEWGIIGRPMRLEACKFPERPPDELTEFVMGCRGCAIAVRAAINTEPTPGQFAGWYRSRDDILPYVDVKWPLS